MTAATPPWVPPSPWPVFHHRFTVYRRNWRGSVFSSFVVPVMFLLGIGITVGSYVDNSVITVPYVDFIAPGVLASTVLQVAFGEATYPVLAGFLWIRTYHAMRASPLRPVDMLGGEMLYIWLRCGTAAAGFLVAMVAFGTVTSPWAPATIPVALLLGAATAAPVLAASARSTTDNWFVVLNRFAIIPMTLFAGVFFPLNQLPAVLQWVAYVTPLWHGVELCRAATIGTATALGWMAHVAALAVWAVGGYLVARRQFDRRLAD
jgi:lipooligosaccharide transport system permease protein